MFDSASATPLATTNTFLGAAWRNYGRSLAAVAGARQQFEPLAARLNELTGKVEAIADDIKDVTSVARRTAHLYGIARGVRAAYHSFVRREGRDTASEED